ncbi:lysostaphin resistance A-like protein [Chloroflexota bacterium]
MIQPGNPRKTVELLTGVISHWQITFIAAVVVSIAVTEWIFTYLNVAYGIGLALGLTLVIYTSISLVHFKQNIVNCAEVLALIPLYILFTSSLPWFFIDQQYLLPAVYSVILALCAWYIYERSLSLREIFWLKKKGLFKYSLFALALAPLSGTIEYFVLTPEPAFPTLEVKYLLRDMVYMLLFVSLAEELLFRGLIQRNLSVAFGWKWALVGTSVIFAVMHLTWRSIPELGFVFVAGMVMGWLYHRTGNLIPSIIFHGFNNVMLVSVAPYIYHLG